MIKSVLVIGATGTQGLPAVKELLKKGFTVRGLTIEGDPKVPLLRELGVEVVYGDLFDEDDLYENMQGMDGLVFIPVIPTASDPLPEFTVGMRVITAAERAGISHMIHTSVDRAGDHEEFVGWGKDFGNDYRMYWIGKSVVIDLVKASKIPHWTILKPAYMMECFIPPKVNGMYPLLKEGSILSTRLPETKLLMMNADDNGKLIAEAFVNFDKFDRKEIPFAGDKLTMDEIAATISEVTGKPVKAVYKIREEMMADDKMEAAMNELFKGRISSQNIISSMMDAFEWDNVNGYRADITESNNYGVKITTFREWCEHHKDDFVID